MPKAGFEWDRAKDAENRKKHGVSFYEAQRAFLDPARIIARDITHSTKTEERFFCFGKVEETILTVRFTYRRNIIRTIGAGYWRKGKRIYEDKKKI
ncbi:MAG: BrnT family toxin [Gammaproteobacteria bacterium]